MVEGISKHIKEIAGFIDANKQLSKKLEAQEAKDLQETIAQNERRIEVLEQNNALLTGERQGLALTPADVKFDYFVRSRFAAGICFVFPIPVHHPLTRLPLPRPFLGG